MVLTKYLGVRYFFVIFIELILASNTYAMCKVAPYPKGVIVQKVGSNIVINGLDLDILRFETSMTFESLRAFYKEKWGKSNEGKPASYTELDLSPFKVIAFDSGQCLYTAQIRLANGGGSEVLLGVSQKTYGSLKELPNFDLPIMHDSKVLSDMASNDSGKTSRLLIIQNNYSTVGNVAFYQSKLKDSGWGQVLKNNKDSSSVAISFRKGGQWIDMTLIQFDGGTRIVANITN